MLAVVMAILSWMVVGILAILHGSGYGLRSVNGGESVAVS